MTARPSPSKRHPLDVPPHADLIRMWRQRTVLLAVQIGFQGGQYIARPDRPLQLPNYLLLKPIGSDGWRAVGALLVVLAIVLGVMHRRHMSITHPARVAVFATVATVIGALLVASLVNHFYVAATLILPLGLCLSELNEIGWLLWRRRRHAETWRS